MTPNAHLPRFSYALGFDRFGRPENLQLIRRPTPTPASEQVLVKVVYSTINLSDLMMLCGAHSGLMGALNPPFVAGMEFSGHVLAGGGLAQGTAVMGVVNPRQAAGGAHQSLLSVSDQSLTPLLGQHDLAIAASLPMNGLTALLALEESGLKAGQSLLITGASGTLGSLLVPLAKAHGLKVFAGCSPEQSDYLSSLGVDHILPRYEGLVEKARALQPQGLDGMIDCALIGNQISAALANGALALSLRQSHPITDQKVKGAQVSVTKAMQRRDLLDVLARAYRDGLFARSLKPAEVYSIEQGAAAFAVALNAPKARRIILRFGEDFSSGSDAKTA